MTLQPPTRKLSQLLKRFARVDAKLNPMPSLIRENHFGGTIPIKNNGGTIAFDSKAIAVVAQNSVGFAFVPLPVRAIK